MQSVSAIRSNLKILAIKLASNSVRYNILSLKSYYILILALLPFGAGLAVDQKIRRAIKFIALRRILWR